MIAHRREQGLNPIIAEIKVSSPMHGDMLEGRREIDILRIYESCNVAGISYITAREFNGDRSIFRDICRKTDLPVLRKDFIVSKKDIEETAGYGASAILLIARMLKGRTSDMVDYAIDQGLEPLVEVHSYDDIAYANDSATSLVAINNRDITLFETDGGDVEVTRHLYRFLDDGKSIVSASGIQTPEDVTKVMDNCDAALVGTAFMRSDNTRETVRAFVRAKKC